MTPTQTPTKNALLAGLLAMAQHARHHPFEKLPFPHRIKGDGLINVRELSKLLLNGWSAEYALRITPVVNDQQYLHSSLHWTFPQAFYSILFSARALLLVRGMLVSNDELVARKVSSMVSFGLYPSCLNYLLQGIPGKYKEIRPVDQPALSAVLSATRDKQFKALRNRVQISPPNGNTFGTKEYKGLAQQLGQTTFFSVLQRLRISNNQTYQDVLTGDELDVRQLHACLVELVNRINQVHEAYIANALGLDNYQTLAGGLPGYLKESFVIERLNTLIPILAA